MSEQWHVSAISVKHREKYLKAYSNMEFLLIGVLSSQDVSSQMDYMKGNHANDVGTGYLFSQLEILKVLVKDAQINCFADVLKAVKSLSDHEKYMITEVIVICKLLLVNPATSATGERSFSKKSENVVAC